ncbi:MAG: hypothetical protein QOE40_2540, partial [Actinomycetota bacterium]|nr:hypothetical protein [Actinomycetota bacterium]
MTTGKVADADRKAALIQHLQD